MKCYANEVIQIALNEVGYLEKKSNSNLDNKTANNGSGNWTKYARDLAAIDGWYNGNKNGYAWCDVFVDWCFVQAFGVSDAKRLLCQTGLLGAGCKYSYNYYKSKGQAVTYPKIGDQIFFQSSGSINHTGLVYEMDGQYVYTVEGNTSSTSGVIANVGAVEKKKYKLSDKSIAGYGRPAYDAPAAEEDTTQTPAMLPEKYGKAITVSLRQLSKGCKGEEVRALQILLMGRGYDVGDSGADGKFGGKTKAAVEAAQRDRGLKVDGIAGVDTWSSLLN